MKTGETEFNGMASVKKLKNRSELNNHPAINRKMPAYVRISVEYKRPTILQPRPDGGFEMGMAE